MTFGEAIEGVVYFAEPIWREYAKGPVFRDYPEDPELAILAIHKMEEAFRILRLFVEAAERVRQEDVAPFAEKERQDS